MAVPPSTALVLGCQSSSRAAYWDFPPINSQFCFFMSRLIIYKLLVRRRNISLPSILGWWLGDGWAPRGGRRWAASRALQRGTPRSRGLRGAAGAADGCALSSP